MTEIRTSRLLLRPWLPTDLPAFAACNADPEVMAFFPRVLSRSESDALARRLAAGLDERGWGLWAVQLDAGPPFVGFVGLQPVPFDASFTPAVEIGWRLARRHWGRGIATEAATAVRDHAFGVLRLDEIVSFTSTGNVRSQGVMRRIGMHHDPRDDFDHPALPPGHRLRRHVLFRIRAADAGG